MTFKTIWFISHYFPVIVTHIFPEGLLCLNKELETQCHSWKVFDDVLNGISIVVTHICLWFAH